MASQTPEEVSTDVSIETTNVDKSKVNISTDKKEEITGDDNKADIKDDIKDDIKADNIVNNDEDKAEDMADDNDDNDDPNNDESGENIFTLMYGRDEEYDEESDNEDNDIGLNVGTTDTNVVQNENKRNCDSEKISSKRRSDESDCPQNKRIKAEPLEKVKEEIMTAKPRLTTTIEAVPVEDPPPPIPSTSSEFMTYLLYLNANDLDINDINKFLMSRNLQNMSQTMRFNDLNDFRNLFIPYVLTDLWAKLSDYYRQRLKNNINVMDLKYFLSILCKSMSRRMNNGIEMKCISVVRPKEGPVFRFGQLITIQTAVQPKPNSTTHIITRRKYFGYITSHSIRGTNADNQSEVNHLRLLGESKRESVIVEEINFMTKYSDELYLRNDALIVAEPLVCIHNSYMEARSVFKFDQFPISRQIFDPVFTTKPSGLSVIVNERRFDAKEVEIIQIGLDVVANHSLNNSCFMVINGTKNSAKSTLLTEIIRQIVANKGLGANKVLFTSSNTETLRDYDQLLKSKRIKTYLLETNYEKSLKEFAIKHIEHKLDNKEMDIRQQELYHDCLQYFEGISSTLSVESTTFKNAILDKLRNELMSTCSVVIGHIQDLCNDILFYKYFTSPNHYITCCVVDDSTHITEPQLYSLFWFGIKKFIFGGEYSGPNPNGTDIFSRNGLSRSFYQRYYTLYKEKGVTNHTVATTLFDV